MSGTSSGVGAGAAVRTAAASGPAIGKTLSPSCVSIDEDDRMNSGRESRVESSGGEAIVDAKDDGEVDDAAGLALRRAARREGAMKGMVLLNDDGCNEHNIFMWQY